MPTGLYKKQLFRIVGALFLVSSFIYLQFHQTSLVQVQQVPQLCDCTTTSINSHQCRNICDYEVHTISSIDTDFIVTDSTIVSLPSVTLPADYEENIGECHGCLGGRQLIAVQKGWICSQPRIGNKMFMMAPAIAAAATRNITFVLPKGDNKNCEWIGWLQDIFQSVNSTVPLLEESEMRNWANIGEIGLTKFFPLKLSKVNTTLSGYRQTWRYFETEAQSKAVRKAFQFTSKYKRAADRTINAAKSKFPRIKDAIMVGVHMRIGDLLDGTLKYGYVMANETFYLNAMKRVKTYFNESNSIIYLVASDTISTAKKMLSRAETIYNIAWSEGTDFEDFASLSKCDHSIISGGTFGFWVAWLANGETFYFDKFVRPGSRLDKGFSSANFYLQTWNPVGWN